MPYGWSGGRFDLGSAGVTEGTLAEVNPLYGVGAGHGAAVVLAVTKIEGVTQLVNGFLEEALAEKGIVAVEAVELLPQAIGGDDGAGSAHLGFPENVFQDRDIEVDIGDGEETPGVWTDQTLHTLQNFRRMILLAFGVIGRRGIEDDGENFAGNVESPGNGGTQVLQQ